VRALDAAGSHVEGLTIRRPSLDDVFLAVTGHAAEEAEGQPAGGGRRRPAGRAGRERKQA
jgi:ABC-2 type transport system ATP-binding protein